VPGVVAWLAQVFGQLNRSRKREPDPYRAFVIGPDQFAIAVHCIAADYDGMAIERARQLQGDVRIELWCGSRKVADIPAEPKAFRDC
jgi:hypothetical protein